MSLVCGRSKQWFRKTSAQNSILIKTLARDETFAMFIMKCTFFMSAYWHFAIHYGYYIDGNSLLCVIMGICVNVLWLLTDMVQYTLACQWREWAWERTAVLVGLFGAFRGLWLTLMGDLCLILMEYSGALGLCGKHLGGVCVLFRGCSVAGTYGGGGGTLCLLLLKRYCTCHCYWCTMTGIVNSSKLCEFYCKRIQSYSPLRGLNKNMWFKRNLKKLINSKRYFVLRNNFYFIKVFKNIWHLVTSFHPSPHCRRVFLFLCSGLKTFWIYLMMAPDRPHCL